MSIGEIIVMNKHTGEIGLLIPLYYRHQYNIEAGFNEKNQWSVNLITAEADNKPICYILDAGTTEQMIVTSNVLKSVFENLGDL